MNPIQTALFTLFAIVTYIIVSDKNVEEYLVLIFKILRVNFERMIWMIKFHPKNPITNFLKEREYAKLAEELHKEMIKND